MYFARQASQHIALNRAGLGFLSNPASDRSRTFGNANRLCEGGHADGSMDGGLAWKGRL